MAILTFYSKLVNDNLPNYFESFTIKFSADTNTITSEIPVDYCQKLNMNFQGNL